MIKLILYFFIETALYMFFMIYIIKGYINHLKIFKEKDIKRKIIMFLIFHVLFFLFLSMISILIVKDNNINIPTVLEGLTLFWCLFFIFSLSFSILFIYSSCCFYKNSCENLNSLCRHDIKRHIKPKEKKTEKKVKLIYLLLTFIFFSMIALNYFNVVHISIFLFMILFTFNGLLLLLLYIKYKR